MSEDLTSKVLMMGSLIEYQEGAVVSRTVVKKKNGTVTLFAFDKGQELSEHSAPFDAIVEVLEGAARVTIDGDPHEVSAGEMLILPAAHPHAVHATERFKMMLTMIRGE